MGVPLALGNTVKPPELVGAREEIENALQWLARMTWSFASSGVDGQELHLFFEPRRMRFLTPEIATATIIELSLLDLVLQFEEGGVPSPHAMNVDDKSSSEIEAWLLCEMLHRGFERDRFSKRLPYKSDHLLSGDERKYAPGTHLDDLQGHADLLVAASRIIGAVRECTSDEPTDMRSDRLLCWPESVEIGFISHGRDGTADLKVGYTLPDPVSGAPASFFVALRSPFLHMSDRHLLSAGENGQGIVTDSVIVEKLSSMMASKRLASAH